MSVGVCAHVCVCVCNRRSLMCLLPTSRNSAAMLELLVCLGAIMLAAEKYNIL